jgi:hypothetical protein
MLVVKLSVCRPLHHDVMTLSVQPPRCIRASSCFLVRQCPPTSDVISGGCRSLLLIRPPTHNQSHPHIPPSTPTPCHSHPHPPTPSPPTHTPTPRPYPPARANTPRHRESFICCSWAVALQPSICVDILSRCLEILRCILSQYFQPQLRFMLMGERLSPCVHLGCRPFRT